MWMHFISESVLRFSSFHHHDGLTICCFYFSISEWACHFNAFHLPSVSDKLDISYSMLFAEYIQIAAFYHSIINNFIHKSFTSFADDNWCYEYHSAPCEISEPRKSMESWLASAACHTRWLQLSNSAFLKHFIISIIFHSFSPYRRRAHKTSSILHASHRSFPH